MIDEIYEVIADTPLKAIELAKQGEGLQESFKVEEGSYRVENSEPGFEK
jgi:hypothetical protein